jgi:hypothetical protein
MILWLSFKTINMDPEESAPLLPPAHYLGGNMGGNNVIPPRENNGFSHHSRNSHRSSSRPMGALLLTQFAKIILHISSAAGLATFGYIDLAAHECSQEDAITAYFNSTGHEVVTIPCLDFDAFMTDSNLSKSDMVFVTDLPRHVNPTRICIHQANRFEASPKLD